MATKTISITEDAYNILKSKKEVSESFSEAIVRLSGRKNLSSFFGVLGEKSGLELEKNIKIIRKKHAKLHLKRLKEFNL